MQWIQQLPALGQAAVERSLRGGLSCLPGGEPVEELTLSGQPSQPPDLVAAGAETRATWANG